MKDPQSAFFRLASLSTRFAYSLSKLYLGDSPYLFGYGSLSMQQNAIMIIWYMINTIVKTMYFISKENKPKLLNVPLLASINNATRS